MIRKLVTMFFVAGILSPALAEPNLPVVPGDASAYQASGVSGDFTVKVESLTPVEGVSRYKVSFPSPLVTEFPQNNEVIGELYLPKEENMTSDPVIILHILNGNFEMERLVALELARAGAPAFWFKLPFYGERRPESVTSARSVTAAQLLQLLDQGALDFQRSADFVSAWSKDGQVSAAGISMGGILAYYFAAQEPRVGKIVSIMAGGDLWGIIQQARETRHMRAALLSMPEDARAEWVRELQLRDPLQVAPLLRERIGGENILMINAALDEVIPRTHAEKLAEALGIQENIYWVEGVGHYSIVAKLREVIGRMVQFLTNGTAPVELLPEERQIHMMESGDLLIDFLGDLGNLIDPSVLPPADQCFEASFVWESKGGDPVSGMFSWFRSRQGLYKLTLEVDGTGALQIGRGEYPWVFLPRQDMLLLGNGVGPQESPLMMSGGQLMLNLQLVANLLQYGVRIPGLLEESGRLESSTEGGVLRLTYNSKRPPATLVLDFSLQSGTCTYCEVRWKQGVLKLDIRELNTATSLDKDTFQPPAVKETVLVNADNLQRAIALFLEVLGQKTKAWR